MSKDQIKKAQQTKKDIDTEQRLFMRILGLFFIFYGFLMIGLPLQYGLGISSLYAPISGLGLALAGIYLTLKTLNQQEEGLMVLVGDNIT